jgi:putative FmdB family regulatory protein
MKLLLDDYSCRACGKVFEELAAHDAPETVTCPECGKNEATRLVACPRIDPRLGVDPAFSTLGDKWMRKRAQQKRIEERRHREHND